MDDPRRRAADFAERRRWNDQALDELKAAVVEINHDIRDMRAEIRDANKIEEARFTNLDQKIGSLQVWIGSRLSNGVKPSGTNWATVLAVAATVMVPIVTAIIATGGPR